MVGEAFKESKISQSELQIETQRPSESNIEVVKMSNLIGLSILFDFMRLYPDHFKLEVLQDSIETEVSKGEVEIYIAYSPGSEKRPLGALTYYPNQRELNWLATIGGLLGYKASKELFRAIFEDVDKQPGMSEKAIWFGVNTPDAYIPKVNEFGLKQDPELGKHFDPARKIYGAWGFVFGEKKLDEYGTGMHVFKINLPPEERKLFCRYGVIPARIQAIINQESAYDDNFWENALVGQVGEEGYGRKSLPNTNVIKLLKNSAVFIGTSLGNPFFYDPKNIHAYLAWALGSTSGLVGVLIPDELEIKNQLAKGRSYQDAALKVSKQARQIFDLITATILTHFPQETNRIKLIDFKEMEKSESYQSCLKQILNSYQFNYKFKSRVREVTVNWLNNKNLVIPQTVDEQTLDNYAQYILYELPVLCAGISLEWGRFDMIPYPGLGLIDGLVYDIQSGAFTDLELSQAGQNTIVDLMVTSARQPEFRGLQMLDIPKSEILKNYLHTLISDRPEQYVPGIYQKHFEQDWANPDIKFKVLVENNRPVACLALNLKCGELTWGLVHRSKKSSRQNYMRLLVEELQQELQPDQSGTKPRLYCMLPTNDNELVHNNLVSLEKDGRMWPHLGFRHTKKIFPNYWGAGQNAYQLLSSV